MAVEPVWDIGRCTKSRVNGCKSVAAILVEGNISFEMPHQVQTWQDTQMVVLETSSPTAETRAPMKTIVFFGPSIAGVEVHRLAAAATHAAPVKRGDLEAVDDYDVIVILDGEFGQSMSESPKEILAVLEKGKTVIGASSMGALRASELDRHGMIGVGWVYDHFRRSAVLRDADVALVYSPFDFKPMTVPMVDVEYWMEQASAAGLIPDREKARVLKAARNIFFADRSGDRLMES